MQSLTRKQAEVLDAIRRHIAHTGQSPTVREIGHEVGLKSSCSVQKHLDTLEKLGIIHRSKFKYRSISLANSDITNNRAQLHVPMMGFVVYDETSHIVDDSNPELLTLPESLLPQVDRRQQADACASRNYSDAPLFALTVRGNSLQSMGINDGDVVIARRQRSASSGDIVIAIEGSQEATVKRFVRSKLDGEPEADNPLNHITSPDEMQVLGKVTLAIKRF